MNNLEMFVEEAQTGKTPYHILRVLKVNSKHRTLNQAKPNQGENLVLVHEILSGPGGQDRGPRTRHMCAGTV